MKIYHIFTFFCINMYTIACAVIAGNHIRLFTMRAILTLILKMLGFGCLSVVLRFGCSCVAIRMSVVLRFGCRCVAFRVSCWDAIWVYIVLLFGVYCVAIRGSVMLRFGCLYQKGETERWVCFNI